MPDDNTFLNLGLNNRPTFFGCNASNFSLAQGQALPPLVVYLPNAPYTTHSNVTTFDPTYSTTDRNDIIGNGQYSASQGTGSLDANWPACMACAALSRSLTRTGTAVPGGCSACFDRYCWDGTLNTTQAGVYEPALKAGTGTATGTGSGSGSGSSSKSVGAKLGTQGTWETVLRTCGAVVLSMLISA